MGLLCRAGVTSESLRTRALGWEMGYTQAHSLRLLFAALGDCLPAVLGELRAMLLHALVSLAFIPEPLRAESTRIGNTRFAQAQRFGTLRRRRSQRLHNLGQHNARRDPLTLWSQMDAVLLVILGRNIGAADGNDLDMTIG